MERLIVSDTHFGCHGNNINFLERQLRVFYDDIIPYARSRKNIRLIHCGDLFDSRSSINPYVYRAVDTLISDLANVFDDVYIVAGNHDYYSPVESEYNINSLDMLHCPDNVRIVSQDFVSSDGDLFVPWYCWDNYEGLFKYVQENDIRNIFCHTDLAGMDDRYLHSFEGVTVYSGHMHTPWASTGFCNLGALYALNFADANSDRYWYTVTDGEITKHTNSKCVRYWRIHGEEISTFEESCRPCEGDFIELYIVQEDGEKYKNDIKAFKDKYNISLILSPSEYDTETVDTTCYDISHICDSQIPQNLRYYYDNVKERCGGTVK